MHKTSIVPNLMKGPRTVLTDEQCQQMYDYAVRIMEDTGVALKNPKAVNVLTDAGCTEENGIVKIPESVLQKALSTAPHGIDIYNQKGELAMQLEGYNTYFGPGPTCVNFKDVETGERRKARKADLEKVARVCENLKNIDFVMGLGIIDDQDPTLGDLHELECFLKNTTKPFVTWSFGLNNLKKMVDMLSIRAGGLDAFKEKPFGIIYSMPVTPLTHPDDCMDKIMYIAEQGLPQIYTPGALFGGTSPVTLAGTLAIGIVDTLVGLIVAQLVNPGTPFVCASLGGSMDFRTMQGLYAGLESNLQGMASVSFFQWLKLPIWGIAGSTDSKTVDAQAAIDATMQIYSFALTGCHLVHDMALTDSGMTGNLDYLVVCDEIVGQMRRMMVGIEVNDEQVPLDVIHEGGPSGS